MKTDRIFYRIFKELPQTFFELWGESVELVDDYRFDSVELKQTALGVQIIQLVVATKTQLLERVTQQQFSDEHYRLQLLNLMD